MREQLDDHATFSHMIFEIFEKIARTIPILYEVSVE